MATVIRHPSTTGKGEVHTEKTLKKLESQSSHFFTEETMCFWSASYKGIRKTSRDSLSASREAGAHRKLSKDRTPSLSQKAQDEQEPVQSFPGSPCSELTPRNQNLSEPRALPGCGLTAAQ